MKQTIVIITSIAALLISVTSAQAQNIDEWFRQKKTQQKYLLEQIAQLRIYLGYVQKGYEITRQGLRTINSIKNGEFGVHKIYYGSLKIVNSKIRSYAKVTDIIENEQRTFKIYRQAWKDANASMQLTGSELSFYYQVFSRILDDSQRNLSLLLSVISDNELEMTDDERIATIDKLYDESQHARVVISKFSDNIRLQAIGRFRDANGMATLKILYNLK